MATKNEIQIIRSLADKRGRKEHGLFVAEGRKLVEEILASNFETVKVYGTGEFSDVTGCETVGRKDLERMSSLKTPQGILAVVRIPEYVPPAQPGRELSLVLDGVQDPGNLGTIIRTADWFGINDIYCSPDTADVYNPKVVQSTMGALLRVRVHYLPLGELLREAAADGIPVYGTFMDGDDIYSAEPGDVSRGLAVLGSEGSGISREAAALVTRKLSVPRFPPGSDRGESLNVATTAAILCAEFRRRS